MGHAVQDEYLDTVRRALAPRFRVEQEIGRGGMATVFLAHDVKHQRQVAVKVLKPELAASLGADRFLREIEIASRLSHPHIVPLHDSGSAAGLLYYVMPYVEGESLRDRLVREKQLPIDEAIRITLDVADALGAAHAQGVIHRDIKPANILLEAGHAMVADFGLARAIVHAGGDTITSSGLIVGTPEYMSPEQAAGAEELDARTDVYSLACVAYEMLAGEAPYTGPTTQAVVAKQLSQPVPSARVVRATIPPGMDAAIQRGLAKVPADRFATAQEFAEALAHPRELKPRPRARTIVAAALTLAAAGIAALLLGPLKPGGRGDAGAPGALLPSTVQVGVLPVAGPAAEADSGRARLIQYLFVSELSRYRGLAIVDPFTLNSRLAGAAGGTDTATDLRRLGLQYAVRVTATPAPGGLELGYVLTDAKGPNIVASGTIQNTSDLDLPARVRQASGLVAAALEEATGGLSRGPDFEPFLARAHNAEAVAAFFRGLDYAYRYLPGGKEHYQRALKLDPNYIPPRIFLMSSLAESGDTAAARAQVRVLESLKPEATPLEQALIGWCEGVVAGDWEAQIRHLRVGLGYSPRNNILLFTLAYDLWVTGKHQEAMEATREAIASGWRFAPLYTLFGLLAIETGELTGLRDTLEAARRISPPDPALAGLLEALALFHGDTAAARSYESAFRNEMGEARLSAGYTSIAAAYRALARRAWDRREPATAISLLRRAVDGGAHQAILRLELARDLAETGNRRDAEAAYRAVAPASVSGADTLYFAGDVAVRLGNAADARGYFTRCLEAAPGGPNARRARERLEGLGRPPGPP